MSNAFLHLDFDECSSSPCDENAICFNLPFTYECICKSGFHGNGFLCSEKESKNNVDIYLKDKTIEKSAEVCFLLLPPISG